MATTEIGPRETTDRSAQKPVVNDWSLQVATVNGSGSQTANTVLLRTIFEMGVPVSGTATRTFFSLMRAALPTLSLK